MSKRIILTPDKVTPTLYKKLALLANPYVQGVVSEVFKNLQNRRKCYKITEFNFRAHATEYYFTDFFEIVDFAGRKNYTINQTPDRVNFVRTLVALANAFNYDIHYDGMIDLLESTSDSKLTDGNLIEVVPEMVFVYTTQLKPKTLVFKLEYFFGTDVINILDAKGYSVNTGKERQDPERARKHAAFLLTQRATEVKQVIDDVVKA